ncbi:uncharacterized protein LOC126818890 isoform X2 [Patella vulgata]|uniref:uncharacterized protein LOC126818890 isoform X2 n=1 Tax=Patella vulgata TaxID=6465 RepID=UPI0021809B50|nr:uncharacterized protein LOC126818890 isoform X2 [Patella vulgata]
MPRRAIRCVVELNLHGVSAPGCWLPSKEDCYLSLALFSQYKNTQLLSSVFPILVNEKFRFEKTYFTALDEEEVIELLEDELVVIELLQMSEYSDGAVHLATYTNNVRDFLYPFETYRPTVHSRDRDIFLERTVAFPGISPKLEFSSKVVVKESYSDDMDALEDAIDYHKNTLKRLRRSKRRPRSCSPRRNNETIAEEIYRNKIQKTGVDDFDINYDNYQNFTRHRNGTKRLRVDGQQAVDFKNYPTFTKSRPSGYILPHLTGTDDPDASIMSDDDDDDDEGYSGAGSLLDDMEDTDIKSQNLRRSGKKSAGQRTASGVLRKFHPPATPRLGRSRTRVPPGKVQPKQSSSGRKLTTPRQLSQDRKSSTSKQPNTGKTLTTTKQPSKRSIIGTPRKVIGSKLKPGSVRSLSTPRQTDRKRPLATIRFPSSQRPVSNKGQPSDEVPITKNGYVRNKTPLNRYPRSKYPLAQTKYPSENGRTIHSNDQRPFAMNEYPVEDGPLNRTRYPRSKYPLAQRPLDTTGYPSEGPYPINGYPNEAQYPTAGYPSEGQYPIAGYPREQQHPQDRYSREGEHPQDGYPMEGQYPRTRFPSEEPYPQAGYPSEGQYPQAGYPSERQYPQARYLSEGPYPQNEGQYPQAGYPNEGQYPQAGYPNQGRSFRTNKDPLARSRHPSRERPLNHARHSNEDKGHISPGRHVSPRRSTSPRRQGSPVQLTGPRRKNSPTRLGSQKRPVSPRRPISPRRQGSPTRQIYPSPPGGKRQYPVHITRPESVHPPVIPTPRQISRQRPLTQPGDPSALFYKAPHTQPNRIGQLTSPHQQNGVTRSSRHPDDMGHLASPSTKQPGGTPTPVFESQYPGVKIRVATTPIGSSAPLPQVINHKYGQNIVSDYAQNPNDPYFISRTPSPTLHQRIEDLTLYHESDVRPPFVVRKLDTDLIGRQPGGVTDQNAKSKPHKCIRLNKFKPGTVSFDGYSSLEYLPNQRTKSLLSKTPTSSRKSPIYGYKKYFDDDDDDEHDDDSEVAELTSRVRDYGVPYRTRSVSPGNRQRSLSPSSRRIISPSSRLITAPRSRKDLYDSPLNRRLPNVRISREYSPRNTYYGRDDVERSHRYRYPTHDTLDDLALDTSLAKYRSQVHIDNGHYWTERAAELSGKSHRELFNDNISKIYNRLNRKARTLR